MTNVANPVSDRPTVLGQVSSKHDRRSTFGAQQTSTKTQECRLSGAVRPLEQNRFARIDPKRRAGERGKPTKKNNNLGQIDNGHS